MNLEGRGYGLFKKSRNFLLEILVFSASQFSERIQNVIWIMASIGTLKYLYLWYFLMPHFPQQTKKLYQIFHFGMLFKTGYLRFIFHHIMIAILAQRQQYIQVSISYCSIDQWRIHHIYRRQIFHVTRVLLVYIMKSF